MQNSNLSSKIFPSLKEDWLFFVEKVSSDLQKMITTYSHDRSKYKELGLIINKIKEIKKICKDNPKEILNYQKLFMHIDDSRELKDSFGSLEFFKNQDNLDNLAVKDIYNKIINSPNIIKINSEYNSLAIKIPFDNERIKRLSDLIRGSKIDYNLIRELLNKYKLNDTQKKNIMLYPVVMLSVKQNEVKNNNDNINKIKHEKVDFYRNKFNELTKLYHHKKESLKDLLIRCFNVREKMSRREIDTYNAFANNPDETCEYEFDDDIKFKIYTLAFFKIKKDIECFIDGINDLLMDENNLDDEIVFFGEMINEFDNIANKIKLLIKDDEVLDESNSSVFFALDAFNRLLVKEEILSEKNRSSIRALLQKTNNISNSRIDGIRTNHMLGVSESENILNKNISILITSKIMLAYIIVGKNILIITGDTTNTDRFDRIVNRVVEKNIVSLRRQIALIEGNDFDYRELQNEIIKKIVKEEDEIQTKAI